MMMQALAKMLGLPTEHAEASMHSEQAARAVLTRRNLFATAATLAAGSAFSFGRSPLEPEGFYSRNADAKRVMKRVQGEVEYWCEVRLGGVLLPGVCGVVERVWTVQSPADLGRLVG